MDWEWATSGPWVGNSQTDTEWKWEVKNDNLYIAFKGSTSRLDWLQNFSFWIAPYRDMPIKWFAHAGFVEKWKSIEDAVFKIIEEYKNMPIHVYGFSQGGAVACLCHESIRFHYPGKIVKTITWGAPRSVWFWNSWKIKKRFNGLINKQNRQDIVPNMPPFLFGYRHMKKK